MIKVKEDSMMKKMTEHQIVAIKKGNRRMANHL
jgi:hypothetical protein